MKELRLRTPEGVPFSYAIASPVTRMLALLLDLAIVGAGLSLLGLLASRLGVKGDLGEGLFQIVAFFITLSYGIALEYAWRGQTLGKRVLGLRVVDRHGLRLTFAQIAIRNLMRPIDLLPLFYLVGGMAAFLSRHGQRLGDMAGNTVVIRQRQFEEPDLKSLGSVPYNSLRAYPAIVNRLRREITPRHAGLLLQAFQRRNQFAPEARPALFAELAAVCHERVPLPPELEEALTDEQYIRNVIDILYEKAR